MLAISYALFGYGKERSQDCFDFSGYLHGLALNLRLNRLIYPDAVTVIHLDQSTYEGYKNYFDAIQNDKVVVNICEDAPLTKAMLWRLKPIFEKNEKDEHVYSHVLCRDLDSPTTYREAQAVKYWMDKGKAAHAITDSVSHTIPMLGGMVGFVSKHFIMYTRKYFWKDLFENITLDFRYKGTDQTYLNNEIYPLFAKHGIDSITQHYVLGMPNTFLSDCHNHIQDIEIGLPEEYKESNLSCGHIGASGWYQTALFKFLRKYWDKFEDLNKIERDYKHIFWWQNE
jgi:hypothetical protein